MKNVARPLQTTVYETYYYSGFPKLVHLDVNVSSRLHQQAFTTESRWMHVPISELVHLTYKIVTRHSKSIHLTHL